MFKQADLTDFTFFKGVTYPWGNLVKDVGIHSRVERVVNGTVKVHTSTSNDL